MKKTFYMLAAVLFLFFSFREIPMKWKLDTTGMKIHFELPTEPHQMNFTKLDAVVYFDPADPAGSGIIAVADVHSLESEDPGLTTHLLSADFFDADKFPAIRFVSSKLEKSADGFLLTGLLTMKDSTHSVSIPFNFEPKENSGIFKGKFSIYSGDYGVMKKSPTGKDLVNISFEIPVKKEE